MKKSGVIVASVAAASATAISSASSCKIRCPREDESAKNTSETSASQGSSTSEKFAPRWGPSNFPWTYTAKETCYLLKGKVKVYPDESEDAVEIGAGDLVVFPKGMSCWDVSEAVDKHYQFN